MDRFVMRPFFIHKYDPLKMRRDDEDVEFIAQLGNILGSVVGDIDEDDQQEEEMQQSQQLAGETNDQIKKLRRLSTALGRLRTDV